MKRLLFIFTLCIFIFAVSCKNKTDKTPQILEINNVTNKEVAKETKLQHKPIRRPDSIKPGKKVIHIGPQIEKKNITLNSVIKDFDKEVKNAKNCEELMKACMAFDKNIKTLSKKDKNISISSVEKRDDVMAIRKLSEEKSLEMCQTQQLGK